MFCTKCGETMADDADFCGACGTQVIRVRPMPTIAWNPAPTTPTPAPSSASSQDWTSASATRVGARVLYAGFWLRAMAYMVDIFLLGLLATPLLALLLPADSERWRQYSELPLHEMLDPFSPAVLPVMVVVMPVVLLCGWLYYALCESSSWQGTLGKKWLRLWVSDLEGRPVTFGRASARFFGKIITGFVPFGIGYFLAGFTARKQALHDILAGCLVLRRP